MFPMCVCTVQALCNSGVVYRELDRLEEAVAAYKDALAVSETWQAQTRGVFVCRHGVLFERVGFCLHAWGLV